MILAEKIMTLRKKKGWSQEELAEKLNISRQSVSKWESGASIPDIDKIILISGLFGVSTDYLLKDEVETEEISEREIECGETDAKCVSVEEADLFLRLKRKIAVPAGLGTALCILSPIPMLLLAGLSEYGNAGVTEDMAGGFGVTVLLILLAIGVGILVYGEMKLSKYEYIEKENLTLQYGVRGIVERNREGFARTDGIATTAGTVLCILGVVPLMIAAAFSAPDMVYIVCVAVLLALVAVAVFLFVWAGSIKGSFNMLLQEGDYTAAEKLARKRMAFFPGAYWCAAVAVFLAVGMRKGGWGARVFEWKTAAFIWPVAALLYAVLWMVIKSIVVAKLDKKHGK